MVQRMPHVQIRNVPPEIHRKLKVRAATAGLSLSEYLLREVARVATHPTREEVLDALRALPPVRSRRRASEHVREIRDAHS